MQNPSTPTSPAATASRRMTTYAIALVVLGLIGFGLAFVAAGGTTADATPGSGPAAAGDAATGSGPSFTPLIFTVGPALLMLLMAFMSRRIDRSKAVGMIGIHLGMLLPIVFGIAYATVGWGRFTAWQAGEKPFLNVLLFAAMVVASLLATIGIVRARPSKAARES